MYGLKQFEEMANDFLSGNDKWVAERHALTLAMMGSRANEIAQRLWGKRPHGWAEKSNNGSRSSAVPY